MAHQQSAVPLSWLIERVVDSAYSQLHDAISDPSQDSDRARRAYDALTRYRQHLLRLQVDLHWSVQATAMKECDKAREVMERHEQAMSGAADQLCFLQAQLEDAKAPPCDVLSAIDVLSSGQPRLPAAIADVAGGSAALTKTCDREITACKAELDILLRERLLRAERPPQLQIKAIQGAKVSMTAPCEFDAVLSLGGPLEPSAGAAPAEDAHLGGWLLLSAKLLVAEVVEGDAAAVLAPARSPKGLGKAQGFKSLEISGDLLRSAAVGVLHHRRRH